MRRDLLEVIRMSVLIAWGFAAVAVLADAIVLTDTPGAPIAQVLTGTAAYSLAAGFLAVTVHGVLLVIARHVGVDRYIGGWVEAALIAAPVAVIAGMTALELLSGYRVSRLDGIRLVRLGAVGATSIGCWLLAGLFRSMVRRGTIANIMAGRFRVVPLALSATLVLLLVFVDRQYYPTCTDRRTGSSGSSFSPSSDWRYWSLFPQGAGRGGRPCCRRSCLSGQQPGVLLSHHQEC